MTIMYVLDRNKRIRFIRVVRPRENDRVFLDSFSLPSNETKYIWE